MQRDMHYCAIAALARAAGFSPADAHTIAYASQFVDDSVDNEPLAMLEDEIFQPALTAHYGFASFADDTCERVYVPFHFLPPAANPQTMADFITRPGSSLARELVAMAAGQPDRLECLVGLGVALHTFADTWSHQDFCGWKDPLNQVAAMFKVLEDGSLGDALAGISLGNVGHIQAISNPDLPYLHWRYLAGGGGVEMQRDNQAEFLTACQRIHQVLASHSDAPGQDWGDIQGQVAGLLAVDSPDLDERCGAWREAFGPSLEGAWGYDPLTWRREAIREYDGFIDGHDDDDPTQPEPVYEWLSDPAGLPWAAFHRVARRQVDWVLERVPVPA